MRRFERRVATSKRIAVRSMKSAQVQKKWNEVQKSVVRTILCPFDLVSIPLEIGELNSIPLVRGPITETE